MMTLPINGKIKFMFQTTNQLMFAVCFCYFIHRPKISSFLADMIGFIAGSGIMAKQSVPIAMTKNINQ